MTKQLDEFAPELRGELDNMMEGSREIFMAAYTSASENGMDDAAAQKVAWNTVNHDYVKGEDGKWRRRPQQSAIHNKSITTGGN